MKRKTNFPLHRPAQTIRNSNVTQQISSLFQRAFEIHRQGHIREEAAIYEQILKIQPNHFDALRLLATALLRLQDFCNALCMFDRAIAINQSVASVYNNRGVALKELGHIEQALISYNKAIVLKPDYVDAYYNRGNAQKELNELDQALNSYDKAIALKPDYANAHNNRGVVLKEMNQFREALASFDQAILLNPNYVDAHNNRGTTLQELKQLDEALDSYNKAITLDPSFADAYYNRGTHLQELKRLDEALLNYIKALSLKPNYDFLFGIILHTRMHLCMWEGIEPLFSSLTRAIEEKKKVSQAFDLIAFTDSPEIHKVASEIFVQARYPTTRSAITFKPSAINKKITIGYFSADFHEHATMHLMAELFEKHDRSRYEFIAFSFGPSSNDAWQVRARKAFDQFIECSEKSNTEIAKISRDLGVDIAVDLKGLTQHSRTGIFAARAAPIQVNFIGYPGTMGADYIDYLIADEVLIPEHARQHYTEKIAYLPSCYQPNCRSREVYSKVVTRPDFGLPENCIVFSSFNNNYKITPQIFGAWSRILKAVEDSVLWLLAMNPTAEMNLRQTIEKAGINPSRLIFAQKIPVEEHLSRIPLADLMLDTFPYGAHTTSSDALRMGLPIITLKGESFASRVAASLLTTVGLPDLITESLSSYEALAIDLAKNPEKLVKIRSRLAANVRSSPLFNPEVFAKNLESLYVTMFQRHLNGLPVDHIGAN